ncbi:MAG: hypothetical protein Q9227_003471 [Pyrenula ochraceoflavens]
MPKRKSSAISEAVQHSVDGRVLQTDKPLAFADSVVDICETIPWFQSYQSSIYTVNNVLYGMMLKDQGGADAYMDDEIIITRIGNDEIDGKQSMCGAKQRIKSATLSMNRKQPVGIIIHAECPYYPRKLPLEYKLIILGPFLITAIFAKWPRRGEDPNVLMRLQKCDLISKSPWSMSDTHPLPLEQRDTSIQVVYGLCLTCGSFTRKYRRDEWVCTNQLCSNLGRDNNQKLADPSNFEWDEGFLSERFPIDAANGVKTFEFIESFESFAAKAYHHDHGGKERQSQDHRPQGFVCGCGRINRRLGLKELRCLSCGYISRTSFPIPSLHPCNTKIVCANDPPPSLTVDSSCVIRHPMRETMHHRVYSFQFADNVGTVHVQYPKSNHLLSPDGPDDQYSQVTASIKSGDIVPQRGQLRHSPSKYGSWYTDNHLVFGDPNRKTSKDQNLHVTPKPLSQSHHNYPHITSYLQLLLTQASPTYTAAQLTSILPTFHAGPSTLTSQHLSPFSSPITILYNLGPSPCTLHLNLKPHLNTGTPNSSSIHDPIIPDSHNYEGCQDLKFAIFESGQFNFLSQNEKEKLYLEELQPLLVGGIGKKIGRKQEVMSVPLGHGTVVVMDGVSRRYDWKVEGKMGWRVMWVIEGGRRGGVEGKFGLESEGQAESVGKGEAKARKNYFARGGGKKRSRAHMGDGIPVEQESFNTQITDRVEVEVKQEKTDEYDE